MTRIRRMTGGRGAFWRSVRIMRWLVGLLLVVLAGATGVSTALAVDARSQVHQLRATPSAAAGPTDLARQVATLRARLLRDERPVDGDAPDSASAAGLTGLQRDVHDLGAIIQQYGGGQGEPQIRRVVNELLAICRGNRVLYAENNLQAPACPDDI